MLQLRIPVWVLLTCCMLFLWLYVLQGGEYASLANTNRTCRKHIRWLPRTLKSYLVDPMSGRMFVSSRTKRDIVTAQRWSHRAEVVTNPCLDLVTGICRCRWTAQLLSHSSSASYVLSVSCLFLCGPLRRNSVNARFYVLCCLVLWRGGCYGGPLQFSDEIQAQSTECPEKVRAIDWTRLLCIQTWCLWWFVDVTNVACLFDLYVCHMCVLFDLRRKLKVAETSVSQNFILHLHNDCHNITDTDDYNLQRWTVKLRKRWITRCHGDCHSAWWGNTLVK